MANSASINYIQVTNRFKFDFSKLKHLDAEQFVSTPVFQAIGYDWVIDFYPQGSRREWSGSRICFHVRFDGDHETVHPTLVCSLIKRDGTTSKLFDEILITYCTSKFFKFSIEKSPFKEQVVALVVHDKLQFKKNFVIDGSFELICSITHTRIPPNKCFHRVPKSFNLQSQIGKLLESDETTDLIFDVQSQSFRCHRTVLAARSPVLKAELFGNMAEATQKHIKIEDMSPAVFEALLHFIYTDSFPCSDSEKSSTIMAQHLFVAADRYAIEGLKALCEDKLCAHISLDTVTTTLTLAQQHNCPRLKNACLDFIAVPGTLISLMLSNEYEDLVRSFPSIVAEIRGKVDTIPSLRNVKMRKT